MADNAIIPISSFYLIVCAKGLMGCDSRLDNGKDGETPVWRCNNVQGCTPVARGSWFLGFQMQIEFSNGQLHLVTDRKQND
jgi:hypothetical protein